MHGLDVGEPAGRELDRTDHRRQAVATDHRHAGVAVVEPQSVVVRGDQQRPPGVPVRPDRLAGRVGDPAFDLTVPVPHAVRPPPVRAQQTVFVERGQRRRRIPEDCRLTQPERMRHKHVAQPVGRVVGVEPFDVGATVAQQPDHGIAVAVADRRRQRPDRRAEAVRGDQPGDPHVVARAQPVDEVGQHGPGLNRRQLVGVAHQQQPAVGPYGFEQPGHQRQRHHRGLVDDDHVVRQPVLPVVAEPRRVVPAPLQQPVQSRGGQLGQSVTVDGVEFGDLQVYGLEQAGRGLTGRGGQRNAQRRPVLQRGLFGEQRQQPRHRRRLTGAGAAGQYRK